MTRIHAIRTGLVQVRRPQMESRGRGLARLAHMLFDDEWSEWLPVYAWAIEHDEGIIVVDTGETARVHERGYHPRWHPFYRRAVHFSVHPEEELGPQLRARGIGASRRPAGRAHAPPHRPCGRAVSRDRKPRVGLARRTRARQRSRRTRCRAICRTAGRNGGSRNSSASSGGRSALSKKRCR